MICEAGFYTRNFNNNNELEKGTNKGTKQKALLFATKHTKYMKMYSIIHLH